MLLDFTVENFRSIKDKVTLSMTREKRLKELEDSDVIIKKPGRVDETLKAAIIYGANASGKSNIIESLRFMDYFVWSSAKEQSGEKIDFDPFIFCKKTKNKPSMFEIKFKINRKNYRYGFEVDSKKIHKEWLFEDNKHIFLRELQNIEINSNDKDAKDVVTKTKENTLFLSACAQWNVAFAKNIIDNFFSKINVVSGIFDKRYISATHGFINESEENKQKIIDLLKNSDTGITNFEIEETNIEDLNLPKETLSKITNKSDHKKIINFNMKHGTLGELPLNKESEGTKKLFNLSGSFFDAVQKDDILIIDEFDARLHPLLAINLVKLFYKLSKNAQLIITSHDTNLLSNKIFRRDQVWFTEKNNSQETDLYSLAEYKIRNDEKYEKNYLNGKYGAIPFLGAFDFTEED